MRPHLLLSPSGRQSSGSDIAFLAVFVDVETLSLDFWRSAQANHPAHDRASDSRSSDRKRNRNRDCFQLFEPKRAAGELGEVRIHARGRKNSSQNRAELSPESMDAKRTQPI